MTDHELVFLVGEFYGYHCAVMKVFRVHTAGCVSMW